MMFAVATTALRLSPANSQDAEFLYRLTEEAMREHVEAAWGEWKGDTVRRSVERSNPAKAFYERLGFVITETTKERYFMEYSDRRYLGSWMLCPELCIYEEGAPPASGVYRIEQVDADIRIRVGWTTQAGSAHELEFRAPANGVRQELPAAPAAPTHLSISHVSDHILDSRAFAGGKEVAYARRCASADGALLSTVQVGYRADGTAFRNFQVYRRA